MEERSVGQDGHEGMERVMITGGTGSFGRQMIKFLLKSTTCDIVVYSRDELKQHQMQRELSAPDLERLRFFIGDVRDQSRLGMALQGVDTVIHAAALKQVPAMEYNPMEALKTNAQGTWNLIEAVLRQPQEVQVIGLSTDKAVLPANLYGATKMVAERLLVQANLLSGDRRHRFSVVRYGNVVNSRGSVLPIFKEQAQEGVITVTHPRMTRFWITIEQAAAFVYDRILDMGGGEVFVPRIKKAYILRVAELLAGRHGATVSVIGKRPGEKLHEVLLSCEEAERAAELPFMYALQGQVPPGFWADDHRAKQMAVDGDWEYSSRTAEELSDEEYSALVG